MATVDGTYDIHDNGGVPFRVEVEADGTVVKVYGWPEDSSDDESGAPFPTELRHEFHDVARTFVGVSPRNRMTAFSGGHGPRFLGNTILLDMTQHYIFIGRSVEKFTTLAPIREFWSPVGNSDVPYPYAVDTLGNTYLLIEGVVLLAKRGACAWTQHADDPYRFYYDRQYITKNGKPAVDPPVHDIRSAWLGSEEIWLHYVPNPGKYFQRLDEPLRVILTDDSTKVLTRSQFKRIMRDFGTMRGFVRLRMAALSA